MTISDAVRIRVEKAANHQCEYCRMPAQFVYAPMEIDHIIPPARGGTDDEDNLCFACPRCNRYKTDHTDALDPLTAERIRLFNPRLQNWSEHFAWSDDGTTIIGQTPCGWATVIALNLNVEPSVSFRRRLVAIGWHPPKDNP